MPDQDKPQRIMQDVLATSGRGTKPGDSVTFGGGDDPIFATPFRMGEAAAGVLGAVGLAVSDLWALRTGRTQAVDIDVRAAAASLKSSAYVLRDGKAPGSWDPFTGHYPTRDGRWMYLHCNHPHHREGALRVAGAAMADKNALAAAVKGWDAPALEEAIADAGMVGGMLRSREEWMQHPHAQAVEKLPLFDIVKIGDAPPQPQPLPEAARPLSGIKVLDLTRVLAGPTAGRVLAENGAEVLHVAAAHLPYQEALLMDTHHGKRSAFVDLRDPAQTARLKALAAQADVFSQGYRPGTLAARGFSPEALAAARPGIVCLSLCAYGHAGPWATRRGFDSIVSTVSGLVARHSSIDGPKNLPVQVLDYIAGYLGALGVMTALARRATEGGSWLVRVSLVQVSHWLWNLGQVDASRGAADLPADEVAALSMETETPFGRVRHLRPVVRLSETPAFYALPAVPLGTHPAAWAA